MRGDTVLKWIATNKKRSVGLHHEATGLCLRHISELDAGCVSTIATVQLQVPLM
jgi:hypothetical protein